MGSTRKEFPSPRLKGSGPGNGSARGVLWIEMILAHLLAGTILLCAAGALLAIGWLVEILRTGRCIG